jgi:hypothetical protein
MLEAATNQEKIMKLKEMLRDNSSPPKQTHTQKESFANTKNAQRKQLASFLPLEQRYLELEEKFSNRFDEEWRLYEGISIQVEILQEEARAVKKEIERGKDAAEQRASALEKEMGEEVVEQTEEIRAIRKELIEAIEKKYKAVKLETMAALESQFESGWDEARDEILGKMEGLRSHMEHEEAERDELVTFMVNKFGEEILKVEQMVQREREDRIEGHKRLLASMSVLE